MLKPHINMDLIERIAAFQHVNACLLATLLYAGCLSVSPSVCLSIGWMVMMATALLNSCCMYGLVCWFVCLFFAYYYYSVIIVLLLSFSLSLSLLYSVLFFLFFIHFFFICNSLSMCVCNTFLPVLNVHLL